MADEEGQRRKRSMGRQPGAALNGTALTVLVGLIVGQATPAVARDAAAGLVLARTWCSACHVVEVDQVRASVDVPPFVEVANRDGFSQDRLAEFLADPHPRMPNMALTVEEIANLGAYIASLSR